MPVLDAQALVHDRIRAIARYHEAHAIRRAELDVSGGVDSATMLGLLAHALGPENVTAAWIGIHSDPDSLGRARAATDAFGVALVEVDLSGQFDTLLEELICGLVRSGAPRSDIDQLIRRDPTVVGSIRSTLRAPVGRAFNRLSGGGIRHGTGNECEDRWLRFYQKGGDGDVDTNPLAMLSKAEVYQLALALGVPERIVTALPSPDLWGVGEQHNDEAEIAAFLGLSSQVIGPHTLYGRIDERGGYASVGLIERVSRFLDERSVTGRTMEHWLFGPVPSHALESAGDSDSFAGLSWELVEAVLLAARRAERITRHKENPSCPTLGTRQQLLDAGILTDRLPVLSTHDTCAA